MEFELVEELRDDDRGGDSRIVRDQRALKKRSTANPEANPEREDRALHIPEEEKV